MGKVIEGVQIKLFRLLNKGSNFPNDEEMRTIIQASDEIKKAVMEALPKKQEYDKVKDYPNQRFVDGYNKALADIIKAVEEKL